MVRKAVLYNPNPLSEWQIERQAPLALLAISRFLDREGYDMHIISHNLYDNPQEEVLKRCEGSICLGITCLTGYQIIDGLMLAKKTKEKYPNLPIVWGGWHPSMEPHQTLEHPLVDVVVRGQGEITFTELVHHLEEGRSLRDVLGVSYKKNGKIIHNPDRPFEDLNKFPPLPWHLIDVEKCVYNTEYGKRTINFISSQGCPFRCNFCEEQIVYKRRWSGLNAKRLVDEIEFLVNMHNIDSVAFHDSNFFVNKKRVKEFCEELIRRDLHKKIKWGNVNGRTGQLLAYEDELWELMEKSGMHHILVGAESGFQDMLDFINKDLTVEDTVKFTMKCKKHGFKVIFSFFVGVPWDSDRERSRKMTEKEFQLTLDLINKIIKMDRRHRIILSHYTPYPGSPLYYKAIEGGFQPPMTFEGWGEFRLERKTTPWISTNLAEKISQLSTYIFFFKDAESFGWVTERINKRVLKFLFRIVFRIFEKIADFRWRYKILSFPIDFKIFCYVRDHGKLFGFYRS